MNNISYTDYQKKIVSEDFIKNNPSLGYLKIQASAASSAYPIEGAEVVVYKDIGDYRVIFFRGKTDSSGTIENIVLPAPNSKQFGSLEVPDFSIYNIDVEKDGYENVLGYSIGIFSKIKVIQNVVMNPIVNIEELS